MQRLLQAVSAAVILFFVVLGLVIGSRMDQTTIALLGGTAIGLLIATPCTAIATYLALRCRDESSALRQNSTTSYYVVPQISAALPALSPQPPASVVSLTAHQQPVEAFILPPKRKFYVIGGDGVTSEVSSDEDTND